MAFLDIHAHILPDVDDGAKDMQMAMELLQMLKEQGVTHVIATPHFYPDTDSAEDFSELTKAAYKNLQNELSNQDLPKLFLGCELRYFNGIGKSRAIKQFTISGTDYLLLELPYGTPITKTMIQDITDISERQGLIPIMAHIERYAGVPGFKKLLKLIADGYVIAHINAGGILSKESVRICEKLLKGGYVSFMASDTHSPEHRPPQIKQALDFVSTRLGDSAANRLIVKSTRLLEEIEVANEHSQFKN